MKIEKIVVRNFHRDELIKFDKISYLDEENNPRNYIGRIYEKRR